MEEKPAHSGSPSILVEESIVHTASEEKSDVDVPSASSQEQESVVLEDASNSVILIAEERFVESPLTATVECTAKEPTIREDPILAPAASASKLSDIPEHPKTESLPSEGSSFNSELERIPLLKRGISEHYGTSCTPPFLSSVRQWLSSVFDAVTESVQLLFHCITCVYCLPKASPSSDTQSEPE